MKKEEISLRDYFAGKAMQVLIECDWNVSEKDEEPRASCELMAEFAYEYADAMIKEKNK